MRNPDTALGVNSIWAGIARGQVETQIKNLEARDYAPDPIVYKIREQTTLKELYPISAKAECQLADDFAFIAACEPGVQHVSAAMLIFGSTEMTLNIALAANEGIQEDVKMAFDEITHYIRFCAKKGVSREVCRNEIFDIVTKLNRNRILGRLESGKFRRPHYLKGKGKSLLHIRLQMLFREVNTSKFSAEHKDERRQFEKEFADFTSVCEALENTVNDENIVSTLQSIIKMAYSMTVNGVQLGCRLKSIGLSDSVLDKREIRELNKLANYWRISCNLAEVSRSYREIMTNIKWQQIEHYTPSQKSKVISLQYVHAEMQLLVYYELHPPQIASRAIGSSKECCFLCDSFIKAYGKYQITKSHRQIYSHWTVPNLKESNQTSRDRFQKAIRNVIQDVNQEWEKAERRASTFQLYPLQSSINILLPEHPAPSVSTCLSNTFMDTTNVKDSENTDISVLKKQSCQHEQLEDGLAKMNMEHSTSGIPENPKYSKLENLHLLPLSDDETILKELAATRDTPDIGNTGHQNLPTGDEKVIVLLDGSGKAVTQCGWLKLHISMSQLTSGRTTSQSNHGTPRGRVSLERLSAMINLDLPTVCYEDLANKVAEFYSNQDSLKFILQRTGRQSILVSCIWEILGP